jgi:hypothetical protein
MAQVPGGKRASRVRNKGGKLCVPATRYDPTLSSTSVACTLEILSFGFVGESFVSTTWRVESSSMIYLSDIKKVTQIVKGEQARS